MVESRFVADVFDVEKLPFGKRAGDNKFGFMHCPTCSRPATHPTPEQFAAPQNVLHNKIKIPKEGFYLFRDKLSAREYGISGMCQHCQDLVFGGNDT